MGPAGLQGPLSRPLDPEPAKGPWVPWCCLRPPLFARVARGVLGAAKRLDAHPRARRTARITQGLTAASRGSLRSPHTTIPMPIYRYQEPPTKRQCLDCRVLKFTASQFDWVKGWPSTRCKDCRREHDQRRYRDKVADEANREHLNAQRRARYRLAKERAAQAAAYDALPAHERVRIDEAARKAKEDLGAAQRLREAKVALGRWREREIRAGRMQRPPNVNPYTGEPRPTKEERTLRLSQRDEDAPRPKPPGFAALVEKSNQVSAARRARQRTARLPWAKSLR